MRPSLVSFSLIAALYSATFSLSCRQKGVNGLYRRRVLNNEPSSSQDVLGPIQDS